MSGARIVLKLGGELLEDRDRLPAVVSAVAAIAAAAPTVVVHGGGREIDAALRRAGLEKRQVDGLRITDAATLDVVVGVLAGTVNTRFVAALTTAGVRAVGLTGADAGCGLAERAPAHRATDGRTVDLGEVGVPSRTSDSRLLATLVDAGYVPVVASVGIHPSGCLLNVNADTFAGHLAARLGARRLIIAGTTPGVLGPDGRTVAGASLEGIERLVEEGTATAGMVAKLTACAHALTEGVPEVVIVDGRDPIALETAAWGNAPATATLVHRRPEDLPSMSHQLTR